MRLGELFSLSGLYCPEKHKNIEYTQIVTDSRKVTAGSIFIAVRGQNSDGHEYISQAMEKGAAVIIAEHVHDECVGGAAIILVDNTRLAAARLYDAQYGFPSRKIKITGVTGTNGKTSTCLMLESIFSAAGVRCASLGTLGCRILGVKTSLCQTGLTTPPMSELYPLLAVLADMGVTHLFMEVSSHALAQHRTGNLQFECGIFTGLTRDHLDFHGSMENYFLAKASLFTRCNKKIFNIDDVYGKRLAEMYRGSVAVSRNSGDYTAHDVCCTMESSEYTLIYDNQNMKIKLGALGDFSVTNSLLAAAAASELGISSDAVREGLSRFFGADGRMQRVTPAGCDFETIIDFAHTPDALENVLFTVRDIKSADGKIILLFGCGGERDRGKRKQMGAIASRLADMVIVTSDNPRGEKPEDIIKDILKGIDKEKPHKVIVSRAEAVDFALKAARKGDILLFCGKGHEKYQIDKDGVHPFDEEQLIRSRIS